MATIVQSPDGAARQFWNAKMQAYPNIAGVLAIISEIAGFFINGHFIVALARWIIRVSGYIAESALLFSVLWISFTSVAPKLVLLVMDANSMQYFVSMALVALALIPEIILANAIVSALGHVHTATQRKTWVAWIWAGLFIVPTLLFLGITAYTINTLTANGGNFVQAGTTMVGLRCFAGWGYGLLEMVYAGVGKRMMGSGQTNVALAPDPAQPAYDYQQLADILLPTLRDEMTKLIPAQSQPDYQQLATTIGANVETNMETKYAPQFQFLQAQLQEIGSLLLSQIAANTSETTKQTESETEDETNPPQFEQEERETNPRIAVAPHVKKPHAKRETKHATNSTRGAARQKALRILNNNAKISPVELAKKAGITPQYASQIMKQQAKLSA